VVTPFLYKFLGIAKRKVYGDQSISGDREQN